MYYCLAMLMMLAVKIRSLKSSRRGHRERDRSGTPTWVDASNFEKGEYSVGRVHECSNLHMWMLSIARSLHSGRNIYSTATCLRVRQQGVLGSRTCRLPPQASAQHADALYNMSGTQILAGTEDRYDGVQIDPAGLPSDPTEFTLRLTESLLVTPV